MRHQNAPATAGSALAGACGAERAESAHVRRPTGPYGPTRCSPDHRRRVIPRRRAWLRRRHRRLRRHPPLGRDVRRAPADGCRPSVPRGPRRPPRPARRRPTPATAEPARRRGRHRPPTRTGRTGPRRQRACCRTPTHADRTAPSATRRCRPTWALAARRRRQRPAVGAALVWRVAMAATAFMVLLGADDGRGRPAWRTRSTTARSSGSRCCRPHDPNIREPAKQQNAENFLIIGSDTRAGADAQYGNVAGARSDTTILVHLSPDHQQGDRRQHSARLVRRHPGLQEADGTTIAGAPGPVQLGVLRRRSDLHHRHGAEAHRHRGHALRRDRLRRLRRRWSTRWAR